MLKSTYSLLLLFVFMALLGMSYMTPSVYAAKPKQRAFAIGDSLTVGSAAYWKNNAMVSIKTDAKVGRTTNEGLKLLNRKHAYLILGLGTNDGANDVVLTRKTIQKGLKYSSKCLIIYTLYDKNRAHNKQNKLMRSWVKKNRKIHLVDWAKIINDNPKFLASDGVHGTSSGYKHRSRETIKALYSCKRN